MPPEYSAFPPSSSSSVKSFMIPLSRRLTSVTKLIRHTCKATGRCRERDQSQQGEKIKRATARKAQGQLSEAEVFITEEKTTLVCGSIILHI